MTKSFGSFRQMPPLALLEEVPDNLGLRVTMLQLAIFADLTPKFEKLGLTHPSRMTALGHIAANPGCSQSNLATFVGLSRASVMNIVNQLDFAGFVERRPGENGRTNALFLTPKGRDALNIAHRIAQENEHSFFDVLNKEEKQIFGNMLNNILRHIENINKKKLN